MNEVRKSKILTAARSVFLRYGFRRVTMQDIAEAADFSRPALYLLFKSKEEIFIGVYQQWVDETLAEIEREMATATTPHKKIERAFEIWAVRPFEIMISSPEAKELVECSFGFAQTSISRGYIKFESIIVPVVATLPQRHSVKKPLKSERIAHVLASAVRGFKLTAATPAELRQMIMELLTISFIPSQKP
jgi:AcrR family transcriptional regulator